jgi:hypothetical protein
MLEGEDHRALVAPPLVCIPSHATQLSSGRPCLAHVSDQLFLMLISMNSRNVEMTSVLRCTGCPSRSVAQSLASAMYFRHASIMPHVPLECR